MSRKSDVPDPRKATADVLADMKGIAKTDLPKAPQGGKVKVNRTKPKEPFKGSPVTAYVRSLGDYKTVQEVADILGIAPQTVRKYAANRVTQAPSFYAPFGKTKVYLYTKEDIQALRDYLQARRAVIPTSGRDPVAEPEHLKSAREARKKTAKRS